MGHALQQTHSLPTIQNVSEKAISVQDVDERGRAPFVVRWKHLPNVAYYKVYFSRDKDFSTSREYRTTHNYLYTVGFSNHVYYWRVVGFHRNGQRLSDNAGEPFSFALEYASSAP